MEYLIGLDIGTSSVKAVMMSVQGKICKCETQKFSYFTRDDMKLMDADEFCNTCFKVIKKLTSALSPEDKVLALCPSGASGNLLFVKNGKAISPIYGWQTQYDQNVTDKVLADVDKEFVYRTCGWPKLSSLPLTALAYFKETAPETAKNADMICMHIEYLNFVLTGKWGITPSMGTPFYLINQEKGEYEHKFLNLLDIDASKLPPIVPDCTPLGTLNEDAALKTGLCKETIVVAGTFDHPAAARGAGVFEEDQVLISCGTSWVVFVPFSHRAKAQSRGILTDPFMAPRGNWCGMKSMTSVSDTIDTYIRKYLGDISYAEFDALADQAALGAGGLVIGEDTDTSGFDRCQTARAIMESIAVRLREFLKLLDINARCIRLVGGISKSPIWCRVIEEITEKEVRVINGEHAGATGSAFMAGVGAGVYTDEKEAFDKCMGGK